MQSDLAIGGLPRKDLMILMFMKPEIGAVCMCSICNPIIQEIARDRNERRQRKINV